MKIIRVLFLLGIFSLNSSVFADLTTPNNNSDSTVVTTSDADDTSLKQCKNIVKMCKDAGYARNNAPGKRFWRDCMKPILLGQSVAGVTVDPKDVADCRNFKISKMRDELQEFQQASPIPLQPTNEPPAQ